MNLEKLIYDRTIDDVSYAMENPNSSTHLKGAYNYTDLNRVESNIAYICETVNEIGILSTKLEYNLKTDWKITDIPTIEDINRIRNNIIDLLNKLNIQDSEEIEQISTMDYIKANKLEKNLSLLKESLSKFNKMFRICGTFYANANDVYL